MEATGTPAPDRDKTPAFSGATGPEIASVVFLDIVGYSRLGIESQTTLIGQLRLIVQQTAGYRGAKQRGNLLALPTGDGMALVFFESPLIAVECATEIAKALKEYPALKLRTGVHMGPVSRTTAINDQMNVAGGGINFAQRVMDSGDAGHILVSKAIADILLDMDAWRSHVRNLGDHKVKHGVVIRLYNLTGSGFGNPARPAKLKGSPGWKIGVVLLLCVAGALAAWRLRPNEGSRLSGSGTSPAALVRELTWAMETVKMQNGRAIGTPMWLAAPREIVSGQGIRFHVWAAQAGSLYLLNESAPAGNGAPPLTVLFPDAEINSGSASIPAGRDVSIPPDPEWLRVDGNRNEETFYLIWSKEPVGALQDLLGRKDADDFVRNDQAKSLISKWIAYNTPKTIGFEASGKTAGFQGTRIVWHGDIMSYALQLQHR